MKLNMILWSTLLEWATDLYKNWVDKNFKQLIVTKYMQT